MGFPYYFQFQPEIQTFGFPAGVAGGQGSSPAVQGNRQKPHGWNIATPNSNFALEFPVEMIRTG